MLGELGAAWRWMHTCAAVQPRLPRPGASSKRLRHLARGRFVQWVGDHPVILFNDAAPPDRVRLTLAHELGHLVLHAAAMSVDDVEAEANAFAAEFLMPTEVVRPSLRNLKIGRLIDLKREYGVSMQALVERAYHLDLLSPTQRTSMYKMFSFKGWRIREPASEDIAPGTCILHWPGSEPPRTERTRSRQHRRFLGTEPQQTLPTQRTADGLMPIGNAHPQRMWLSVPKREPTGVRRVRRSRRLGCAVRRHAGHQHSDRGAGRPEKYWAATGSPRPRRPGGSRPASHLERPVRVPRSGR